MRLYQLSFSSCLLPKKLFCMWSPRDFSLSLAGCRPAASFFLLLWVSWRQTPARILLAGLWCWPTRPLITAWVRCATQWVKPGRNNHATPQRFTLGYWTPGPVDQPTAPSQLGSPLPRLFFISNPARQKNALKQANRESTMQKRGENVTWKIINCSQQRIVRFFFLKIELQKVNILRLLPLAMNDLSPKKI